VFWLGGGGGGGGGGEGGGGEGWGVGWGISSLGQGGGWGYWGGGPHTTHKATREPPQNPYPSPTRTCWGYAISKQGLDTLCVT
jgi:hypothetical protein